MSGARPDALVSEALEHLLRFDAELEHHPERFPDVTPAQIEMDRFWIKVISDWLGSFALLELPSEGGMTRERFSQGAPWVDHQEPGVALLTRYQRPRMGLLRPSYAASCDASLLITVRGESVRMNSAAREALKLGDYSQLFIKLMRGRDAQHAPLWIPDPRALLVRNPTQAPDKVQVACILPCIQRRVFPGEPAEQGLSESRTHDWMLALHAARLGLHEYHQALERITPGYQAWRTA